MVWEGMNTVHCSFAGITKNAIFVLDNVDEAQGKPKVYGCIMPPGHVSADREVCGVDVIYLKC